VENNSPLQWQNPSAEESRADMVKALCLKDIHKIHIYSNREWHSSCCISLKIQIGLDIDVSYQDNQASSPMDISAASTCLLSRLCASWRRDKHDRLLRAPAAPAHGQPAAPGAPPTSLRRPAHSEQSAEAACNCLMQIADGHFISTEAEPPLARRGVAFVPLRSRGGSLVPIF